MIEDVVMNRDEFTGIYTHSTNIKDPNIAGLVMALQDWKVWWLVLAIANMTMSMSFNVFFPTLSATMGYGRTVTLLLCAPPWIFATATAFLVSRYVLPHLV